MERKIKEIQYEPSAGKCGYPPIWIILILDNGDTVRIADRDFKKIWDDAP